MSVRRSAAPFRTRLMLPEIHDDASLIRSAPYPAFPLSFTVGRTMRACVDTVS